MLTEKHFAPTLSMQVAYDLSVSMAAQDVTLWYSRPLNQAWLQLWICLKNS